MVVPKLSLYSLAALLLMATGFLAGRLSAAPPVNAQPVQPSSAPAFSSAQTLRVQFDQAPTPDFGLPQQQTPQAAPDPREMIPLQPGPGQQQGNQPGQQGNAQDCPVFIYQDGQLYMMPRPGQQPGQGQGPGPGIPGDGSPELIPLQPGPGLPSPGPTSPDPFAPKRPKADSRS